MGAWDIYEDVMDVSGRTLRETALRREKRNLSTKLPHSLSSQIVMIDNEQYEVAIIDSDNLDEKMVYSIVPDVLKLGRLVFWEDNYWLITEKDVHTEVITRVKMVQCNHLLKWIDADGVIHEQWCIISDGTKYSTGEYEDKNFIVARGDSRISMKIGRNKDTVKFNRESRFLIDDPESDNKLAYLLTKPLKSGYLYGSEKIEGLYSFVLQEVASTKYDNHKLGIADYYKVYPNDYDKDLEIETPVISPETSTDSNGKKVWI